MSAQLQSFQDRFALVRKRPHRWSHHEWNRTESEGPLGQTLPTSHKASGPSRSAAEYRRLFQAASTRGRPTPRAVTPAETFPRWVGTPALAQRGALLAALAPQPPL